MYLVMALATTAEIIILTAMGRRGLAGTIGAGLVVLAASVFSSRNAYAVILFSIDGCIPAGNRSYPVPRGRSRGYHCMQADGTNRRNPERVDPIMAGGKRMGC